MSFRLIVDNTMNHIKHFSQNFIIRIVSLIGAFATGMFFSIFGVIFICIRSSNVNTKISFIGLSFQSDSVGITAIFLGSLIIIFIVPKILHFEKKHKTRTQTSNSLSKLINNRNKIIHVVTRRNKDAEDTEL